MKKVVSFSVLSVFVAFWVFSSLGVVGCSPAPNEEPGAESGTEVTTSQDGGTGSESATGSESTSGGESATGSESASGNESATGNESDPTDTAGPAGLSYAKDITPIFQKNGCLGGYCHGGNAGGLNLTNDGHGSLVGADSTSGKWKRVVAGDPGKSLLFEKVSKDSPDEGSRMPQGGKLTDTEIQTIETWITEGAKP
ncbi:MAG: hypothetical protein EP343_03715 [Deltaproteobacteria bacterium]|nr:MAG: hypothetical protein EP343_03715 [Deltaproteobacteria bacterium]